MTAFPLAGIILIIFMEVKKSPKADLEGRKSTWLLVGYVVVLAFMFVAFEWTQRDVKIDTSQAVADLVFEEEIIPITETPEQHIMINKKSVYLCVSGQI